ncbi:MAG: hypothetical protein V1859_09065 [archaeon]
MKINRILLIIVILIVQFSFVNGLDCQYSYNNPIKEEKIFFYENGDKTDYNLLEVRGIQPGGRCGYAGCYNAEFTVYNLYDADINVTIFYNYDGIRKWINLLINANGYKLVNDGGSGTIDPAAFVFDIHTPGLEAVRKTVYIDNYICMECPEGSGTLCLDDGSPCTESSQCGGGYCIKGLCSHSKKCYNNNCSCAETEIQCIDNIRCMARNSVNLGSKPICMAEECISGYISKMTGNCAYKDGQKCTINSECESNLCIKGVCSNNAQTGACYNNDCKCNPNEIQCQDNTRCVVISSVEVGDKPKCSFVECKTKYINNESGLCDNRPKKLGESCLLPTECESNYCIRNICSDSIKCYLNDCKCNINEKQCEDNSKCVTMSSLSIGSKPICISDECKSKYVNPKTGKCDYEARTWVIIYFFIGLMLIIPVVFFFVKIEKTKQKTEEQKQKTEIEKQKTIGKHVEALKEESNKINQRQKVLINEAQNIHAELLRIKESRKYLKELNEKTLILMHKKNKTQEEIEQLSELRKEVEDTVNNSLNKQQDVETEIKKLIAEKEKQEDKVLEINKNLKDLQSTKELTNKTEKEKEGLKSLIEEVKNLKIIYQKQITGLSNQLDINQLDIIDKLNKTVTLNSYQNLINESLNKYKKQYDGSGKSVIYDEQSKYFKIVYKLGNETTLQRYVYEKANNTKLSSFEEVHHIDCDPLNNEPFNLIALQLDKHTSFSHGKIWKKDWLLGYNELKRQLKMIDEDFPEHIKKYYKEKY